MTLFVNHIMYFILTNLALVLIYVVVKQHLQVFRLDIVKYHLKKCRFYKHCGLIL